MVRYLPGATPPQLAFSVTRRVGPAVVRNRVRRQMRACVRAEAASARLRPGAYLVSTDPPVVERTFAELCNSLHEALQRAGALS